MDKKYKVYGLGNAVVDYEVEVTDAFFEVHGIEKGLMTLVEEDRQLEVIAAAKNLIKTKQSGGSGANSIISLAQFGGKAFYSCKVANDEDGKLYMAGLSAEGVDCNLSAAHLEEGTTGKCLVMVTEDAERTMNTYLGITSTFSTNELVEEAIENSEYIFIEGYLVSSDNGKEAMIKAKEVARESGTKVSLSFSDPAMVKYFQPQMKEVVGDGVDLLFCNEEEAMLFTQTESVEDAKEALKLVAKQFVITLGSKGACVFDGSKFINIESFPVNAVDTTGAGDMFCGAFLYGITHGHSMELSGKLASKAAATVVSKFGPRLEREAIREVFAEVLAI